MLFSVWDYINDASQSTLEENEFTKDCEKLTKMQSMNTHFFNLEWIWPFFCSTEEEKNSHFLFMFLISKLLDQVSRGKGSDG